MIGRSDDDTSRQGFDLENLCDEFEKEWEPDSPLGASIEKFIDRVDEPLLQESITELVACDFELRSAHGQSPTRGDYCDRFPQFQQAIDAAFEWLRTQCETSQTASDAPNPTRLGDYRIVREIGRGGMGIVYEAVQESLGRRVAIKTLIAHPLNLPELRQRFERETRAVGSLHHTNIVDVYGTGEDVGIHYFAMQLVEGKSLRQIINEQKELLHESGRETLRRSGVHMNAARIGIQVARALEYAHGRGVLHRDIKPANLLLDQTGNVQVTDFGLAKMVQEEDNATRTGDVVGTLRYLPPEAIDGQWDERGDVYGLGVTLYELLALRPAYGSTDRMKVLDQIARDELTPLRKIDPTIPRDLETIVLKGLARAPKDRYQSARAMADDLQRFLHGQPIVARVSNVFERLWKWSCRKPALAALCGVLTLVAFIGFPTLAVLWQRAESALGMAEQRQVEAEAARDIAKAQEYRSLIQLAQKYTEEGIAYEVEPLLRSIVDSPTDASSEGSSGSDRRDWEWNFLEQQLDTSAMTLRGHSGVVHFAAIRPDDKQIATVGGSWLRTNRQQSPGEVILWDAKTGTQQHVLPGDPSGVMGAAYSSDGTRLATISLKQTEPNVGPSGSIKIWDPETGSLLQTFPQHGVHPELLLTGFYANAFLPGIQFSRDDKWLVSWPDPVDIRDASSGEIVWSVPGRIAAVHPDGKHLVVSEAYNKFGVFDLESGTTEETKKTNSRLFDIAVSRDEKHLYAMIKGHIRLWTLPSFQSRDIVTPDIKWGAIAPDGRQLIYGDRRGVLHFQPLDEKQPATKRMGHESEIRHGAFSHDGHWLVTSSYDETARVWNMKEKNRQRVIETRIGSDSMGDIAFGDDGQRILFAASGSKPRAASLSGWRYLDASGSKNSDFGTTNHTHWPRNDFAYSFDGEFLAAPAREARRPRKLDIIGYASSGRIGIWSAESMELQQTIETSLPEITSVAWSRDSAQLAVAGLRDNQSIIMVFPMVRSDLGLAPRFDRSSSGGLEMHDGEPQIIELGEHLVSAMTFHPGGKHLAASTADGIDIFHLPQPDTSPQRLSSRAASAAFLEYSPSGDRLAAVLQSDRVVLVYDTDTGVLRYETAARRSVCCVRFSPNGRRFAMVGYDSLVHFCDAENGYRLLTLHGAKAAPGNVSFTARVIFSPDGRRVATNDWQGRITVWEADLP